MRDRMRDDGGFAMMAVVMGIGALIFIVIVIFQSAVREYHGAQYQRRDDTIIAGAEGMLERYAAKLTIDPRYYQNFVDQAELPRRCTDATSSNYGLTAQPGDAWYDECQTWDYPTVGSFFDHPLLSGRTDIGADDIGTLLTVQPPTAGDVGVTLTIVSGEEEFGQNRAVEAVISPQAISEFAFLVEQSLRFGSGAVINGKIYVGEDLDFDPSPVQGVVHRNVYAEDAIGHTSGYGPPIFADGSRAYDGIGEYLDIRSVYPDPLDFANFWDDLDLIRQVACGGGGLCLSRSANPSLGLTSTPTAWLLEPSVSGSQSRVKVSVAYSNTTTSCLTAEEWWWLNSQSASWTTLGTYDVPPNGVIWVDGHTVIGKPGAAAVIGQPTTIYAGSVGSPKNVVIGTDITYQNGVSGTTVLGLIASDEVWVNPNAVGSDRILTINTAMLTQNGSFQVARDCGTSGSSVLPYSGGVPIATLNTNGSMAIRYTGDVAAHFGTRNYGFDDRLESLRPPLFPLMGDTWTYGAWSEVTLPCWAQRTGCG
ncbi:MAG: hypothetical protein V1757_04030 [Actinomycetota bacterium]